MLAAVFRLHMLPCWSRSMGQDEAHMELLSRLHGIAQGSVATRYACGNQILKA